MKQINLKTIIGILIFVIGILLTVLMVYVPNSKNLIRILLAVSAIYLVAGWYFFRGYFPDGHPFLLFIFGYLYSSVFISITFVNAGWPLAKTFISLAPVWTGIQFLLLFYFRRKIPQRGLIQFSAEGLVMLVCLILYLIKIY